MGKAGKIISKCVVAMGGMLLGCGASAVALATAPANLALVCKVTGQHKVSTTSDSYENGKGSKGEWRTGTQEQIVPFSDQVTIMIEPGRAQVQYPRAATPTIHGGKDGWFDIRALQFGDDEISGEIALNFANHPKLKLDRRTGYISVSEPGGSFAGSCEKIDTTKRAF